MEKDLTLKFSIIVFLLYFPIVSEEEQEDMENLNNKR